MAYVTPKTNWAAGNIPVASDLNRIEGNTKANHDAIEAEAIARSAGDVSLAADIGAEESSRIADDLAINNILSGETVGTYGTVNISGPGNWVIPKGMYNIVCDYESAGGIIRMARLQIYTGSGWESSYFGDESFSGLVISDGSNYRLLNNGNHVCTVRYRKLA